MISEHDKQAILDGAYGVSRGGVKVKFIGRTNNTDYPYQFIYYAKDTDLIKDSLVTTNNFLSVIDDMSTTDVIGLWEDKPEPFDLERALDGELVKYSDKPCYVYQSKVTGLFWVEAQDGSFVDNDTSLEAVSEQGMWKEPEPVSKNITVTLPRALRAPRDEMWCFTEYGVFKSSFGTEISKDNFKRSVYFGTEEDAKAWFDAMQDSRK